MMWRTMPWAKSQPMPCWRMRTASWPWWRTSRQGVSGAFAPAAGANVKKARRNAIRRMPPTVLRPVLEGQLPTTRWCSGQVGAQELQIPRHADVRAVGVADAVPTADRRAVDLAGARDVRVARPSVVDHVADDLVGQRAAHAGLVDVVGL